MQAAWGWGILGHLLVSLPPVMYLFFNLKLFLKAPAVGLTCSGETLGFPIKARPQPSQHGDTCRCVPIGMLSTCSCRDFAGKAQSPAEPWPGGGQTDLVSWRRIMPSRHGYQTTLCVWQNQLQLKLLFLVSETSCYL